MVCFTDMMPVGGPMPLKGDLLVVAGSMLYAVSNVSEVWNNIYSFLYKVRGGELINVSCKTTCELSS